MKALICKKNHTNLRSKSAVETIIKNEIYVLRESEGSNKESIRKYSFFRDFIKSLEVPLRS